MVLKEYEKNFGAVNNSEHAIAITHFHKRSWVISGIDNSIQILTSSKIYNPDPSSFLISQIIKLSYTKQPITCLAWKPIYSSSDLNGVFVAGTNGMILIFAPNNYNDIKNIINIKWNERSVILTNNSIKCISIHPYEPYILSSGKVLDLWNIKTPVTKQNLDVCDMYESVFHKENLLYPIDSAQFSPDGRLFAELVRHSSYLNVFPVCNVRSTLMLSPILIYFKFTIFIISIRYYLING